MTDERLLTDLFTERSDDRPAAAEVLAAVQQRLASPRRPSMGAMAGVAGAVAVVAAVGVTVAVVPGGGSGTPAAGGPLTAGTTAASTAGASSSATSSPAPSTPAVRSTTPVPPSSTATVTTPLVPGSAQPGPGIQAGWLPAPGRLATGVANGNLPDSRDYDVRLDGTDLDVIVWSETNSTLPSGEQATGGGTGRDLTLGGHPAREFVADHVTIVAVDLGHGLIVYAGPSAEKLTATLTSARITAIAEHVAESIYFTK